MLSLPERLTLRDLVEQAWNQVQHSVLEQHRRTIEGLLGAECDRRVAEAHLLGDAARTGSPTTGVCQSRFASLAIAPFEAFQMARTDAQKLSGSGTRQSSLGAVSKNCHSLHLPDTQRDRPLGWSHGVTFSRCC